MRMKNSVAELNTILADHAARYPLMQPTDAVKLIYQNEFGGGHMIPDEQACMNYLRREYAGIEKAANIQPAESIGNGIVRVRLSAVKPEDLDALGREFIRSANAHKGNMERFLKKLDVLRSAAAQGIFSFDTNALEAYLADYAKAGYPPVSHSETFRSAYHPAYRIVLEENLPESIKKA